MFSFGPCGCLAAAIWVAILGVNLTTTWSFAALDSIDGDLARSQCGVTEPSFVLSSIGSARKVQKLPGILRVPGADPNSERR